MIPGEHGADVPRPDGAHGLARPARAGEGAAALPRQQHPLASLFPAPEPHASPPYLVMRPEHWQWWLDQYGPYIRETPR